MKCKISEDDSALIEACLKKDLKAWEDLIAKYSKLITFSVERRLKKYNIRLPAQDVEDIKQNVLASIWREDKLRGIKNRANIAYWLSIVSGNAAIEYVRKKASAEPLKTISLAYEIGEKELEELAGSEKTTPSKEILNNELCAKIDTIIESFPPKERLIMKLYLFHSKKYYEIAEMLGLPKGTVSSYINRARDKLKHGLRDFV